MLGYCGVLTIGRTGQEEMGWARLRGRSVGVEADRVSRSVMQAGGLAGRREGG